MSAKETEPQEMCVPEDEACSLYADGMAALEFVEAGMKENPVVGLLNPGLESKIKASKRKLKALKKKWDF